MNRFVLHLYERILFVTFLMSLFESFVIAQNSTMLMPYYFDSDQYILDLSYIHSKDPNVDLFSHIADGAIVYLNGHILGFVLDDSWDRVVYGDYKTWFKTYGEPGMETGQFIYPSGVVTDGLGNIYVADTENSRIVKLEYDSTNKEIDPGSFSTIGEGILDQPWDLDVDDRGNLDPSDDIIWVVDNGAGQIVPLNLDGTMWGNGVITSLYNDSRGAYYWDLTGLSGIAVRKSAAQGYNSTSNRRLYLVDWKLRKLFLLEAEGLESSQGLIYKEKRFGEGVVLSGVESDYFGDVWVVDNAGERVKKYTWDLEYLDELTGLNRPTSVASVRRHHANMAITERWTETTGNRTYSQGANIRNLSVNLGAGVATFTFTLTNYSHLVAKVYNECGWEATLQDDGSMTPSGKKTLNWYKSSPVGRYTLKLWANNYSDSSVYRYVARDFSWDPAPPSPENVVMTNAGQMGEHPSLSWDGVNEPDLKDYEVYRCTREIVEGIMIDPPCSLCDYFLLGTTMATSYTDRNVTIGVSDGADFRAYYHVTAVTNGGGRSLPSNEVDTYGGGRIFEREAGEVVIPGVYALHRSFPNPTNGTAVIRYDLPEVSDVRLTIYDILGRVVGWWEVSSDAAGYKQVMWDGRDRVGRELSSGVYIYRLEALSVESDRRFSKVQKMVLLK